MVSLRHSVTRTPMCIRSCTPGTARIIHYDSDQRDLQNMLNDVADGYPDQNTRDQRRNYDSLDPIQRRPFRSHTFIRPHFFNSSRIPDVKTTFRSVAPTNKEALSRDVFRQLKIDPLHECQNHKLLSAYVSPLGKIRPRTLTGLTKKSQERLGKAIRRAKTMGIIPVMSKAGMR